MNFVTLSGWRVAVCATLCSSMLFSTENSICCAALCFAKQKLVNGSNRWHEAFHSASMSTLSNLALNERSVPQTNDRASDILSVPEACRFSSVHRNTLYKLIRAGELPAFRLITGGHWKYRKGDLAEWLETRRVRSGV